MLKSTPLSTATLRSELVAIMAQIDKAHQEQEDFINEYNPSNPREDLAERIGRCREALLSLMSTLGPKIYDYADKGGSLEEFVKAVENPSRSSAVLSLGLKPLFDAIQKKHN